MRSPNLGLCQSILARRELLAEKMVAQHYALRPELGRRYGEGGRNKCLADTQRHLHILAQALAACQPALFIDYVGWAKVMLSARGVPMDDLAENLEICRQTLRGFLPQDEAALAGNYLLQGIQRLNALPSSTPSWLDPDQPLAALARQYLDALLAGDRAAASRLITQAVREGVLVKDLYLHVFQPSQYEVGRLWQTNQISVGQEHLCTAATQLIMSQLYPQIFRTERRNRRIVAACVGGDLHEIGVRMVADFFEMEGWDSFFLGADVPLQSTVETVRDRRAHVVAVSTTLSTNVGAVRELIEAVRAHPACGEVVILVGGHPFNLAPNLWQEVGADGSAPDAQQAVELAERLLLQEVAP